ncbi:MAG: beta-ketoacyl-[acyl-carrier-protein] synthase II [Candidatus Meridianibacter frigidus]|nr:MAG: beta-ketoacyl-[acyl-carrier-protein] synthase II [Candidatus Eremiobacteraeota bacterium]
MDSKNARHRVVITGIGLVTPLGSGDAFWKNLRAGTIATREISRFDVSAYPSRVAAQIDDFDPADYLEPKRVRWTDRFSQFAIAAAKLALQDADLHFNGLARDAGVFVGSALGGLGYAEEQLQVFGGRGLDAIRPLLAVSVFGGAAVSNISMEFGLTGPTISNANSCASGLVGIGQAYQAIANGDARVALAGGVEAPLSPLIYGAFTVIRAMSRRNDDPQTASRPFDRARDGFVMAEGAGIVLLERYEDAVSRGAKMYAEVRGFGLSSDAYHMSAPRPDGVQVARAMERALQDARVGPDEVEAINAHGSSTLLGDKVEALAYSHLFGERSKRIPVSATKGQHGHALGATGAWEMGIALMGMRDEVIPGAVNLEATDTDCAIAPQAAEVSCSSRIVLSNSSGFGGLNAALVLQATD